MSIARNLANLIGNINAGGGGVNRNVIINGAMNVAQRSTSETGLGASSGYFTCDRWLTNFSTSGRSTMTQDSSAPSGFANSLKVACTTADTSIASDEQFVISQRIEGQNLQAFAKGTSDAKPFSVSFYVKGNASATYICELRDRDNSRSAGKTFNVTTDWTRVELTFPADTTGAFDDDNARSLDFNIFLHAGTDKTSGTLSNTFASEVSANRAGGLSTSFFDSTDRTFFITGVQLEVGQNPTEFEHESFERTLSKCQRYFQSWGQVQAVGAGTWYSASQVIAFMPFHKIMRDAPTMTTSGDNFAKVYTGSSNTKQVNDSSPFDLTKSTVTRMNLSVSSNGTAGHGAMVQTEGSGSYIFADAEL